MVDGKQAVGTSGTETKDAGKFDLTALLSSKNAEEFERKRVELINSIVQKSANPESLVKLQEQIDARIHAAVNADSKKFGEEFAELLEEAQEKLGNAAVVAQELIQKTGANLREVVENRREICYAVTHKAGQIAEVAGKELRDVGADIKEEIGELAEEIQGTETFQKMKKTVGDISGKVSRSLKNAAKRDK